MERSKPHMRNDKRKKRGPSASERLGEPELARREQRRRKFRGKRR